MAEVLTSADTFPPVISNAVRDAALNFFKSSCGLKYVENPPDSAETWCSAIMSTISFVGDPPWTFALVLPDDAAVMVAHTFAGFDIPFDSPDMGDVLGEVVNVLSGEIVARLDAKGIKLQMSLPTVIRGHNVCLHVPSSVSTTQLMFSGPKGTCWFKLVKARGHRLQEPGP